MTIYSPQEF